MKTSDIHIRDPYVLPLPDEGRYLLFGTTGKNAWSGPGLGFDCYESRDLENWTGPIPAFRPPPDFWSNTQFWAPECHPWQGRYFLFASFAMDERQRGTQILVADKPEGPYRLHSDGPVTPRDWECLDGTLLVDDGGTPWEVMENGDGLHETWNTSKRTGTMTMPITIANKTITMTTGGTVLQGLPTRADGPMA